MIKITPKLQERLERYRRLYPENCDDKGDAVILLEIKAITPAQYMMMMTPKPQRKKKAAERKPRVRVMTEKQLIKECRAMYQDMSGGYANTDETK